MKVLLYGLLTVFLTVGSCFAAQVSEEDLYPFGLVSFQKFVEFKVADKKPGYKPDKSWLRRYNDQWQHYYIASNNFKNDYEEYQKQYGLLDDMEPYSKFVSDAKKTSRFPFLEVQKIKNAHNKYIEQYKKHKQQLENDARAKKVAAQEKADQERYAEQERVAESSRVEATVFGMPLHSATKDQLVATIENAGGKLVSHEIDHHKFRFDAKPFVPAANELVITYLNDGRIASYAYNDLSQEAAIDLSQTLNAKYGTAYFNAKGMSQWDLKNGISVTFLINTEDPFNPNFILVYQTKLMPQFMQEEMARRQKGAAKDAEQRRSNQAL